MNNVTRWNPTTAYLTTREPFFRMFDSFFNGDTQGEETRAWVPPVDIQENGDAYLFHAELPGMSKEDIHITLENSVLRVSGERKFEKDAKKENYHRVERTYGTFTRTFTLPTQVDPEKVQAAFENGILTITVPKAEVAKPRRITIS
ncbi:MAG TPA: Hsp20/alpha crystallin family protein [Thermoanaerobaculia bacterium]|jgi:HSP20 family protein|nr:Hsp20/alpha crystallin family protein [Thermoanaerobaculia bacterium]